MLTRLSFLGLALGLLICLSSFTAFTQPFSFVEKGRWGTAEYENVVSIGNFLIASSSSHVDVFDRRLTENSTPVSTYEMDFITGLGKFKDELVVLTINATEVYSIDASGELVLIFSIEQGFSDNSCITSANEEFYILGRKAYSNDAEFSLYTVKKSKGKYEVTGYKNVDTSIQFIYECNIKYEDGNIYLSDFVRSHEDVSNSLRYLKVGVHNDDYTEVFHEFESVFYYGEEVRFIRKDNIVVFNRYQGILSSYSIKENEFNLLYSEFNLDYMDRKIVVDDSNVYLVGDSVIAIRVLSSGETHIVGEIALPDIHFPDNYIRRIVKTSDGFAGVSDDIGVFEIYLAERETKLYFNQGGIVRSAFFKNGKQYVQKSRNLHVLSLADSKGEIKIVDNILDFRQVPSLRYSNGNILAMDYYKTKSYGDIETGSLSELVSVRHDCQYYLESYRSVVFKSYLFSLCGKSGIQRYNVESDYSILETPLDIVSDDEFLSLVARGDYRFLEFSDRLFLMVMLWSDEKQLKFFEFNDDYSEISLVNSVKLPESTNSFPVMGNGSLVSSGRYFSVNFLENSNFSSVIYRINDAFELEVVLEQDGQIYALPFLFDGYLIVQNAKRFPDSSTDIYEIRPDGNLELVVSKKGGFADLIFQDRDDQDTNNVLVSNIHEVAVWQFNQAPELLDLSISLEEDNRYTWDLSGADKEGDSIDVEVLVTPNSGSLEFLPEQKSLSYTPNANFSGSDTLSIKLSDEHGNFHEYELTVDVLPVNDAPVMSPMTGVTVKNSTLTGQLTASDAEQDVINFSLSKAPQYGQVTVSPEGAFEYTPNNDFVGADYFDVEVLDDKGAKSQGRVSIEVKAENLAPSLEITQFVLDEDTSTTFTLDVSNDEGSEVTLLLGDVSGLQGLLELLGEHRIQFTPSSDFFGETQATLVLTDKLGASKTETLTFVVQAVDDPPRPQAQTVSTKAGTAYQGQLANQDIDGDTLTYTVMQTTSNGALTLNANGSYSYTPNAGFSGTDKFTYQVTDSNGNTAQSEVQVTVAKATTQPPVSTDSSGGGGAVSFFIMALLWLSYLPRRENR
ncbi:tandem-95 repeat protein [Bowmanella sp. Y26]|uniref:Ig-like domain-containing protein n=1 Tax=Bowmanella yangjiangensis TaxID=2811230 RepID=UPI001BDC72BE|nr:Ig-like domain-containing protein [Bowmanella yangjiangensis]MBT1063149.1 tandem-95 repeat protein [Bowmanella yangjiangensis]